MERSKRFRRNVRQTAPIISNTIPVYIRYSTTKEDLPGARHNIRRALRLAIPTSLSAPPSGPRHGGVFIDEMLCATLFPHYDIALLDYCSSSTGPPWIETKIVVALLPVAACAHLSIQLFGRHGALQRPNELPYVRRAGRLTARVGNHAEALLVVPELDAPAPDVTRGNEPNARGLVFVPRITRTE